MDDVGKLVIEYEIGSLISNTIMDYKDAGHDPAVVSSLILASCGAAMATLFDDMSVSDVEKIAAVWVKKGFLDANSMDLDL